MLSLLAFQLLKPRHDVEPFQVFALKIQLPPLYIKVQDWIKDACDLPTNKRNYSKLYRMIPNLGYMFHALPLVKVRS